MTMDDVTDCDLDRDGDAKDLFEGLTLEEPSPGADRRVLAAAGEMLRERRAGHRGERTWPWTVAVAAAAAALAVIVSFPGDDGAGDGARSDVTGGHPGGDPIAATTDGIGEIGDIDVDDALDATLGALRAEVERIGEVTDLLPDEDRDDILARARSCLARIERLEEAIKTESHTQSSVFGLPETVKEGNA